MNGWEIKDLLLIQRKAQQGQTSKIDEFIAGYPLAASSPDYSLLAVLRQFHVQVWKGERRILNREPGIYMDKPSEGKQWGITLSLYNIESEKGKTISFCIPNDNYTYVSCTTDGEILIKSKQGTVTTNVHEICSKLIKIYGYATAEEIANSYQSLDNKKYTDNNIPELVDTIESRQAGILLHDEDHECYRVFCDVEGKETSITIYPYSDDKNEQKMQIEEVDVLLENKFYENALKAMYPSMLKVKNQYWLEEGEKPLSIEEFARQIKITSIVFSEGETIVIYCDGAFGGGHAIEIYMDNEGNYKSANICG